MTSLTEIQPMEHGRRRNFSLLLSAEEFQKLSQLSTRLGLSRGACLRVGIANLVRSAGPNLENDNFWTAFRGGNQR